MFIHYIFQNCTCIVQNINVAIDEIPASISKSMYLSLTFSSRNILINRHTVAQ